MAEQYGSLFSTVRDAPQFRSQVAEVAQSVDDLEARLQRVHDASIKYRDALQLLCSSQTEFATALLECRYRGTDESSRQGNEQLTRMVGFLHEQAGLNDVLRTNHSHLLCESIDRYWLQGNIRACRDSKRRMERAAADYDAASKRYLGLGKRWRSDSGDKGEKARVDMMQAEAVAQEARFACVRQLQECDGQQRYNFLEGAVQTLSAHIRNANRSSECMKRAEGLIEDTKEHISQLRNEEQQGYNALDAVISEFVSQQTMRARQSGAHRASELSGNMLRISNRVAADVRATALGAGIVVLKEGFLLKRAQKGMVRSWNRRFFILNSLGVLYYLSTKANQEGRPPKRQLNVMNGAVMPGCEEPNRQHSFTVGTVDNGAGARVLPMFELQAETQADQQEWMTTIQAVIMVSNDDSAQGHGSPQPRFSVQPRFALDALQQGSMDGLDASSSPSDSSHTRGLDAPETTPVVPSPWSQPPSRMNGTSLPQGSEGSSPPSSSQAALSEGPGQGAVAVPFDDAPRRQRVARREPVEAAAAARAPDRGSLEEATDQQMWQQQQQQPDAAHTPRSPAPTDSPFEEELAGPVEPSPFPARELSGMGAPIPSPFDFPRVQPRQQPAPHAAATGSGFSLQFGTSDDAGPSSPAAPGSPQTPSLVVVQRGPAPGEPLEPRDPLPPPPADQGSATRPAAAPSSAIPSRISPTGPISSSTMPSHISSSPAIPSAVIPSRISPSGPSSVMPSHASSGAAAAGNPMPSRISSSTAAAADSRPRAPTPTRQPGFPTRTTRRGSLSFGPGITGPPAGSPMQSRSPSPPVRQPHSPGPIARSARSPSPASRQREAEPATERLHPSSPRQQQEPPGQPPAAASPTLPTFRQFPSFSEQAQPTSPFANPALATAAEPGLGAFHSGQSEGLASAISMQASSHAGPELTPVAFAPAPSAATASIASPPPDSPAYDDARSRAYEAMLDEPANRRSSDRSPWVEISQAGHDWVASSNRPVRTWESLRERSPWGADVQDLPPRSVSGVQLTIVTTSPMENVPLQPPASAQDSPPGPSAGGQPTRFASPARPHVQQPTYNDAMSWTGGQPGFPMPREGGDSPDRQAPGAGPFLSPTGAPADGPPRGTHVRNPSWEKDPLPFRPPVAQPFRQARPEPRPQKGGFWSNIISQPKPPEPRVWHPPQAQAPGPQQPPPPTRGRVYSSADGGYAPPPTHSLGHTRSQSQPVLAGMPLPPQTDAHDRAPDRLLRASSPDMASAYSDPLEHERPAARAVSPPPAPRVAASPLRSAINRKPAPKGRPPQSEDALADLERRLQALMK